MALFPLYINLAGRICRVIGGGAVAARKIEQLLQFEALVTVIGAITHPQIAQWVSHAKIAHLDRSYQEGDLAECFLVIAATADRKVNQQVYQEATRQGIWVNVVDQPQECNFFFPALVKRDDLVVGISTSGKAPALSKKLRQRLDDQLPLDFAERLALVEQFRIRAKARIADFNERQATLQQVAQVALTGTLAELANYIEYLDGRD